MRTFILCLIATLTLIQDVSLTWASEEYSLFNGAGKAEAYISMDDDFTIYLWTGEPVAYIDSKGDDLHVYGFNGKHLGWLINGAIWGHDGNAYCAGKQSINFTEFEPFKSFKQFKPFKSFQEFAPFKPFLTNSFSNTPCGILLRTGI